MDYVRFKALRLNTVLENDWENLQAEAKSISDSVKWVNDWRTTLINKLGVPAPHIDNAERSIGELAYANVLQRHASIDDWFDLHVIMIPCVFVGLFRYINLTSIILTDTGLASAGRSSEK
jgi:thiaminase